MPKDLNQWIKLIESSKDEEQKPSSNTGTFQDPLKKRREYWKDTRDVESSSKPTYDEWHNFNYPLLLDPTTQVRPDVAKGLIKSRTEFPPPGELFTEGEKSPEVYTQHGGQLTAKEKVDAEERYGEGERDIDVMSGADFSDRFWTSFMRDTKDRIQFYKNKYGDDSVRIAKNESGNDVLILKKPDGTDLLVDEEQISDKDLVDIAGFIPEVAGALAGYGVGGLLVRRAAMKPFVSWIIRAASSAGGGQLVGAAQDVAARTAIGSDIQPTEIAYERSKRIAEDMIFDIATGGASKVGKGAFNVAMNPTNLFTNSNKGLSEQAIKARDEIFNLTRNREFKDGKFVVVDDGITIPLDPATLSGSDFVARAMAILAKVPGGSPVKELLDKQKEALMRVHKTLIGDVNKITDEQIGKEIIPIIERRVNDAGEVVEVVRNKVVKSGIGNLEKIFNQAQPSNPFVRESYKKDVGDSIIDEAKIVRDKFKSDSNKLYDLAAKTADDAGAIFDISSYQKKAQDLFGNIPKTAEGETVLELVSPKLREILTRAGDYPEKISFSDIQQLRRSIDDEIAEGIAMRKPDDKRLIELSDTLRKAIEDAGGKKEVQQALRAANMFYKKHHDKFRSNLFNSMFKPIQKGGIGGESLVDSLVGPKSANYLELKELLGPEKFGLVRATALNDIMSRFKDGDTVNATQFLKFLQDPKLFNKQVRDDLLGSNTSKLMKELSLLEKVQDPRVSVNDLEALVKSGGVSRVKIEKLISARKAQDKLYRNKFLKRFVDGKTNDFDPQDFVDHFLNTGNVSEVQNVVNRVKSISPELHENLKRKVLFKYMQLAGRTGDTKVLEESGMLIDPLKMKKLLEGGMGVKDADKKLKAILSPDDYKLFKATVGFQDVLGKTQPEAIMQAAGGLSSSSWIMQFIASGPLKQVNKAARTFIAAKLISSRKMNAWARNEFRLEDSGYLAQVLTTAPPFINAALQDGNYEAGTERLFGEIYKGSMQLKEAFDLNAPESETSLKPRPETRTY